MSEISSLVLIVDDDAELRRGLRRVLVGDGHTVVEAGSHADARAKLATSAVEVVVLDLCLPDASGLDTLSYIQTAPQAAAVIVVTGSCAAVDVSEALRLGATSYLRKPVDPFTLCAQVRFALVQARNGSAERATRHALETNLDRTSLLLEELPRNIARQFTRAWDLRHVETGAHVRRIAEFSTRLSLQLGFPRHEAETLGHASMLHDVGKVAIPDVILNKAGPLTDEEFSVMKQHSALGAELLGGLDHPFLNLAARLARSHHERWDGSGYPDGLVGTACDRSARIVGVVDVYDALVQERCYKRPWSKTAIVDYFQAQRGMLFEPELVDALLEVLPELEQVQGRFPDSEPTRVGATAEAPHSAQRPSDFSPPRALR